MRALLTLMGVFLVGCQMTPTKVTEFHHREFEVLVDKASRPLALTEATVVLDARSAFDYGLNHVSGSIHFPWEKLAESSKSGEVLRDKRKAALTLSLLGLQPTIPVVVVGYGLKGRGEEARVAWTLLYFGFQDVQVASVDLFRSSRTPNPTPAPANVPVWEITPRDSMVIAKSEFDQLALDAKGRLEKRIFILDVRTSEEYLKAAKKLSKDKPDVGAINIEWREFFDKNGRPNPQIRTKLQSLGITPKDRLLIVSAPGGQNSAAAYALLALGYTRVQNPSEPFL